MIQLCTKTKEGELNRMSCYVNETGMKIKNSKGAIMSIPWKDMFHDWRYTSQTNPVYILERYILLYNAKLQRLIQ